MSKENRLLIYTCITGGYDELLEPLVIEPGVDYIYVSDKPPPQNSAWRHLQLPVDTFDAAASNRYVKMHPHILFPEYDVTVYIDGNIQVCGMIKTLTVRAMDNSAIALYQHPFRNCIYSEALACSDIGHDWHWRIIDQVKRYQREGFPANWGLFEANVIIRRNNVPEISRFMSLWWNKYINGVRRDQLSLTYLAWKHSIRIHNLGQSNPRGKQAIFSYRKPHSNHSRMTRFRRKINRWIMSHRSTKSN